MTLAKQQLAQLKDLLHAERNKLTERLAARRQTLSAPSEREVEEGDWAAASVDQSLLVRLVDRDTKLLDEIDRALAKMAGGKYGVCEQSGDPIGFDRLQVRPWARYATAVKESRERAEVRGKQSPIVIERET
jgi:DnaK suppressor protein